MQLADSEDMSFARALFGRTSLCIGFGGLKLCCLHT